MGVSVPRRKMKRVTSADTVLVDDDLEWSLSVGAVSYQRLRRASGDFGFMSDFEDELAKHPYYKVGRPGGCMILCQIVSVSYSTRTPPAEIKRLTAYDFSCFTRFKPCARIIDLLPAAEEWHLYDSPYEYGSTSTVPPPRPEPDLSVLKPSPPIPCSSIPIWAQARDARYVIAVEALSTKVVQDRETRGQYRVVAKVKVVSSLKEPAPWLPGAVVNVDNRAWFDEPLLLSGDDHLIPGRRYIMFAIGNDRRDQLVTKDSPISFDRCGMKEDTFEVRREIEKGFAQNDTLSQ
jgi:hypothetical protein